MNEKTERTFQPASITEVYECYKTAWNAGYNSDHEATNPYIITELGFLLWNAWNSGFRRYEADHRERGVPADKDEK